MRTKSVLKHSVMGACLLLASGAAGQATVIGNAGIATNYLGWDNFQGFPLQIRHDNNQEIQFFTNNIQRMQLLPSDTYSINGFAPQSKSGSLLLARDVANFRLGAPGPYTRLHLADTPNGSQQNGYRSNMQNGVTMTGNNDQMYVGQLYNGLDYTDAAIVWSDNPGEWLADRLTFNFTSGYNSAAPSGSTSFRGLQTMLIQPDASGAEAYVGLGEFDAAGEAPLERLDVLDGRVRVRELPDASGQASGSYKVMVVDDAALPSGERGVVKWVDPSAIADAGCEWTMNTGSDNNLSTAFGSADPNCPDNGDAVGIGVDLSITPPPGKLAVETDVYDHGVDVNVGTSGLDTRGVNVVSSGGANYNYGLFADATGATVRSRGVYGHSAGATYYGAGGIFRSDDDATYATGVQGHVTGGALEADGVRGEERCEGGPVAFGESDGECEREAYYARASHSFLFITEHLACCAFRSSPPSLLLRLDQPELPACLAACAGVLVGTSDQVGQHFAHGSVGYVLGHIVATGGHVEADVVAHAEQLREPDTSIVVR